MGKKVGKPHPGDGKDGIDFDQFTAEDFDWLDDPDKTAAATADAPDLPRGTATRTLRQLEVVLLPAVATARELFRAVARGQSHPPPDPAIASIFADYHHYLHELHASLVADGKDPNDLICEYDDSIGHVLYCFDKLLHDEDITRLDALKADAWLHDVPSESLLFN